jgi:hypothetical protein
MRTPTLAVIALVSLSSISSGQAVRLPRAGGRTIPQPTSLPPQIPIVAQALAYKRSRWSGEAYSVLSSVQVPTGTGGTTSYVGVGAGTRADYRYSDRWSATLDLTATPIGGAATTQTAEVGTRFSPLSWNQTIRPFFDVRAAYMHMYDTYALPTGTDPQLGGPNQQFSEVGRYSRGLGGISGVGLEYSLTNTLAVTTEFSAMRNRMTTYRLLTSADIGNRTNYWMTSYRYTFGFKYNPVRALHLVQKATP